MKHKQNEPKHPMRLNNRFVEALGPDEMWWDNDPRATGFGIRSYSGGGKSWFIDYRLDGRQRRFTLGPFPRWSADAARERAKELRRQIDKGFDPAGNKRERRTAPTVQDLIDRYVAEHLPRKAAATHPARRNDELRVLAEIADKLGKHTKVADIHGGDVRDMHAKITKSGKSGRPVRANRILTICSKLFSLSLVPMPGENTPWRRADLGNPCKGVERNREEARERFFAQSELTAISNALTKYSGIAADAIRLIAFTGCRPREALQAEWREFDAEPGYWIKPSAHTKQRKTHRLPLNPAALELIARLRKRRGNSKFVFPGKTASEPLTTLWHCWEFVRKETGLGKSARIYDLRHTFASVGAGGGLSLPIIGKLLGHTRAATTQRYAHLADDPLREATEKIGAVIANADKPGAPVVPLRGRQP